MDRAGEMKMIVVKAGLSGDGDEQGFEIRSTMSIEGTRRDREVGRLLIQDTFGGSVPKVGRVSVSRSRHERTDDAVVCRWSRSRRVIIYRPADARLRTRLGVASPGPPRPRNHVLDVVHARQIRQEPVEAQTKPAVWNAAPLS